MGTKKPGGGGGGGSSMIRAGQAVFEIFAKDNVSRVVDKIVAKVKGMGQALSRIGSMGMGAGAVLGAGPLGLLLGGGSRLADTARMARQFEVPIQLMNKFAYAAKRAGVSVDEVMGDTRGRFSALVNAAPLIDPQQAEAALQIQNDFTDALEGLQEAMTPLLGLVAPLVRDVTQFVQANAGGVRVLAAASAGLLAFGAAAKVTGISLASLAGLVPLAFGAMTSPIGVAALAVGGLTAAFLTLTDTGRGMLPDLGKGFEVLAADASAAWSGIVGAVKAGDLGEAFGIAADGLRAEWTDVLVYWKEMWLKFKWGFLKDIHEMAMKIEDSGLWKAAAWVGGKAGEAMDAWAKHAAPVADMMAASIRDIEATAALGGGSPAAPAAPAAAAPAVAMVDPLELEIAALRAEAAERRARFRDRAAAAAGGGGPGLFGEGGLFGGAVAMLQAARFGGVGEFAEGLMGGAAQGAAARAAARGMDEVRGGFNVASALSQFGFGSKTNEQTELMKQQLLAEKQQVDLGAEQNKKIDVLIERFLLK